MTKCGCYEEKKVEDFLWNGLADGGGGGGGGASVLVYLSGEGTTWGAGGVGVGSGWLNNLVSSSGIDFKAFWDSFLPSSVPSSKAPAMPTVKPAMKAEKELSRIGLGWSEWVMAWYFYWRCLRTITIKKAGDSLN